MLQAKLMVVLGMKKLRINALTVLATGAKTTTESQILSPNVCHCYLSELGGVMINECRIP